MREPRKNIHLPARKQCAFHIRLGMPVTVKNCIFIFSSYHYMAPRGLDYILLIFVSPESSKVLDLLKKKKKVC